ncbi:hypothetical protein GJAV_G00006770 [Gymnothorax javanicus]|nr:hypothetical protein GJAV_G00006770 [Gymnothorax javanicus]
MNVCGGGAVFSATASGNGKAAIFLHSFEPLQEKRSETFYFPKYLILGPNVALARDRQSETVHSVNEWRRRKRNFPHLRNSFNRFQN